MTIPCVLVTPKRKLAGHLAVMKSFLRFFCEFLVEGTGGSSVFKNFHASSNSDLTKSDQKQNFQPHFDSGRGITSDIDTINEIHKKQLKNVKRHRRWNLSKVWEIMISIYFCSFLHFFTQSGLQFFCFVLVLTFWWLP